MAAGTPGVASNVGSLPEVLGDAALLTEPDDPGDLADSLRRALDDSHLAADLSKRGRTHAATFRWSETARQTHALYRRLLG